MPYDLKKYKFQPGDRVMLVSGCRAMTRHTNGKLVASWEKESKFATIIEVWQPHPRSNVPPWIIVTPDTGFGKFTLQAKEIEHAPPVDNQECAQ